MTEQSAPSSASKATDCNPNNEDPKGGIRLQVALARSGVAARRQTVGVIAAGRVSVNGKIVRDPAHRVCPDSDEIRVDGSPLSRPQLRYYMLHKPPGVLSAAADARGRRTVVDLLPVEAGRCVPVGRLDFDSEGLLLLTNDGPLMDTLLHPRNQIPREYLVEVEGRPSDEALQRLYDGVPLEDGVIAQAKPKRSKRPGAPASRPGTSWLTVALHEGRKREVRQMCMVIGHPVRRLIRVRFGPVRLQDLPLGAIRELTPHEIRLLQRSDPSGRS